nr:hypothetical protein [Cylindrospermopsis raciborskii]
MAIAQNCDTARGTGLLFVIVGCFITTTAIIASQHPKIRQLELAE